MRKLITSLGVLIVAISLVACSKSNDNIQASVENNQITTEDNQEGNEASNSNIKASDDNILIAYFSQPETENVDVLASASIVVDGNEQLGNTEYIAKLIEKSTKGDLFEIKTKKSYPGDGETLINYAADEKDSNARPELSSSVKNMDQYDIVFIGYPNWWADMPMPVYTFLEEYKLDGKIIVPFTTHGGSGLSNTVDTIASIQSNATIISNALSISRNSVEDYSQKEVEDYLKEIGVLE